MNVMFVNKKTHELAIFTDLNDLNSELDFIEHLKNVELCVPGLRFDEMIIMKNTFATTVDRGGSNCILCLQSLIPIVIQT